MLTPRLPRIYLTLSTLLIAVGLTACAENVETPASTMAGDWPQYRGNLDGTGYSPLTQITPGNVQNLIAGWSYSLRSDVDAEAASRNPNSQLTPVMVDGVMYLAAADRVVALDPVSGTELWRHQVSTGVPSRRGVSYWSGTSRAESAEETGALTAVAPRIYFTAGTRLVALDAATGTPVSDFGQNGEIDLGIPYISVPLLYDNVIVIGANTPAGADGGIGNARAFSALSGEALWEFNSVPQPGEFGHDTWEADSWAGRFGANAWPFYFTVDAERELLYLPLAGSLPFAYGGDREGSNLFANSIVAVNIHTGEYVWHFQTIHHDLWDHDPPAPPTLFDIEVNNTEVPALAVTTKSGYLFILNRVSGEPLVDVEERPVPQSDVPGEQTWPTQPIPATPPMARVSYSGEDLVTPADTSPEHFTACLELLTRVGPFTNAGAYSPWTYKPTPDSGMATLLFPGLGGGPNWGGASFDPNSGYVFVFAGDTGTFGWLEDAPAGSAVPYRLAGPRPSGFEVRMDGVSMPCQKPPWGTLSAVDTRTGAIAWQQTLGITEGLPVERQLTGRPGRAGALVTGSNLLFIGATDDNRLRALEASSGRLLWETTLSGRGNANPMTYLGSDGRQYVVISATDSLRSFRLP